MKSISAKLAPTIACAVIMSATAGAQSTGSLNSPVQTSSPAVLTMNRTSSPALAFAASTDRQTWHTVMLISAVLLFAGLVDDNGGLIILGGAGILVALSETNGNAYRSPSMGHGVNLLQMGPVSVGVNPFGQMNLNQRLGAPQPSLVLQAKFKF